MKQILIGLFMLIAVAQINAAVSVETVAKIDDHFKFPFLIADNDCYYIWDQILRKIAVFSRKDSSKVVSFGEMGEGPGQFRGITCVDVTDGYILVSSFPKLCFFSRTGNYIKEINYDSNAGGFLSLGNRFVGTFSPAIGKESNYSTNVHCLYDSRLNKQKELITLTFRTFAQRTVDKDHILVVRDCIKSRVYKNKLFVPVTSHGFKIAVFDSHGSRLPDINFDKPQRPVTDTDKRLIVARTRASMKKDEWDHYRKTVKMIFPEFYPAFQSFHVSDDRIYVFGFPYDDYRELILLDLDGTFKAGKRFPLLPDAVGCVEHYRYTIEDGRFMYIIDNGETETWDILSIDINTLENI